MPALKGNHEGRAVQSPLRIPLENKGFAGPLAPLPEREGLGEGDLVTGLTGLKQDPSTHKA